MVGVRRAKICAPANATRTLTAPPTAQTLGWRGWTTCTVYLLAGSFVTKVKKSKKEAMGIA